MNALLSVRIDLPELYIPQDYCFKIEFRHNIFFLNDEYINRTRSIVENTSDMLKDFILISLLIAETYSLKKCYHQRCEINQGRYHLCDQENYNCTRWNETSYGSTGHCRYWGSPSLYSFINCNYTDTCSSDLVTGQAVCESSTTPAVHDMECTGRWTNTDIDNLAKSIIIWVTIVNFTFFCVVWCLTGMLLKGMQRLCSLQELLIKSFKVKSKSTQTKLEEFPVTQLFTASYPPAQIKYASQNPSHSPPPYYTAAQYPAVPFPAAQYLGAEYPGSNTQCPLECPGTMYHTSTQILQPSVQEPAKNTPAKVTQGKIKKFKRAQRTSAQTTPLLNGPSASDGRL